MWELKGFSLSRQKFFYVLCYFACMDASFSINITPSILNFYQIENLTTHKVDALNLLKRNWLLWYDKSINTSCKIHFEVLKGKFHWDNKKKNDYQVAQSHQSLEILQGIVFEIQELANWTNNIETLKNGFSQNLKYNIFHNGHFYFLIIMFSFINKWLLLVCCSC